MLSIRQLIIAVSCSVTACLSIQAQQVYSTSSGMQSQQAIPPLERVIAINLRSVPLSVALDEIAKRGGFDLGYSQSILPDTNHVSLASQSITVGAALKAVLSGTKVVPEVRSTGKVMLTEGRRFKAQGIITGRVKDSKTDRGVSGASLVVDNDNRGITDDNGFYRLTGVTTGTHTLTVRFVGYAKQTRSITVGEGITVTADFKLEPTANVLDQVVVTGTVAATELKAVPNAMTIVTAKQIEERGITRLEQLFRGDVPGLFAINVPTGAGITNNFGQVALFSRGATAIDANPNNSGSTGLTASGMLTNNMKMYVDGVQLSDSSLKFLGQIDPKSIERIEILTGPQASTVYGAGAINGVIQIFTKRGTTRKPQFTLSFSSGLAESNYKKHIELNNYVTNASLSGLEGRISYRMATSWNHDGSWMAGQQTNTFGVNGGVNLSFGSKITGDASARWSRRLNRTKGAPGGTLPAGSLFANGVWSPSFSSSIVNETAFTGSQGGTLGLNYRQFSWWSHTVNMGFDGSNYGKYQHQRKYANIGDTTIFFSDKPGNNMSQSYNSTMQLPLLSLASLNLTFGGDHTRQDMNNLGWQSTNRITGVLFQNNNANPMNQSKPYRHSGVYVQGRLGIKDALFLTYGVRTDWDPAYGDKADVKPGRYGAAFNQAIGPVTAKLRGSYGRSIRAPKRDLTKGFLVGANQTDVINIFGVFYTTLPNPELVPESQQGGEGGMDLYFGNRGSLTVTRYNQTVDNLIERFQPDSTRSLLPVAPSTFNCTGRGLDGDIYFDDEGYCYRYQNQSVNVGSVRNQGWELQGSMNLGPITTNGTYSWTKSRILGITPQYKARLIDWVGDIFKVGAPFNYIPEHTWALGMTYNNSASTVSLHVRGNGMSLRPINSTVLGLTTSASNRTTYTRERMGTPQGVVILPVSGYADASLYASHHFSSRIDANLNVTNLSNTYRNDFDAAFPAIGRQTLLGLQWRWQ